LKIDPNTQEVQISCIDEGTQFEDLAFELDLDGNPQFSEENDKFKSKYILDIAGSGAYNYSCPSFKKGISLKEAILFEKYRMEDLALRIFNWCYSKNIQKIVVTFHKNCGAVSLRCRSFPGLINSEDFILIESKRCAESLAKSIEAYNQKENYHLKVTIGLINEKQICRVRPLSMHNGLGTLCILDSRFSGKKLDFLLGVNFFNVLSLSDFDEGIESGLEENPEQNIDFSINIIEHSVRNISLSLNIAFGDHGWGEEFFHEEKPFLLFFAIRDEFQEFQTNEIISKIKEKYSDKAISYNLIKVD
jgi:hypothetical protein